MTTPVLVPIIPADAWQNVATNITNGRFIIKGSDPDAYYYTYVDTGAAAPTGTQIGNIIDRYVRFNDATSSDFYIMAVGAIGLIETQI